MAKLTITGQPLTSRTAVCKLAGDLDADGFDALEEEFEKCLNAGILGLLVDASGLDSLSSAGLGALLNMARVLRERDGKLVLASLAPDVRGTIDMLGLQDAVPLADNPDAGRRLLAGIS